MTRIEVPSTAQKVSRQRSAREVLDLHADLHRQLSRPDAWLKWCMEDYARRDVAGQPQWGASHLNPSNSLDDLEPWLASLGSDLFGATTYQVTAEMTELARAMQEGNADLADISEEELPSDWGFMWFDQPVPRPSVEDKPGEEPLLMHAVSWAKIPAMPVAVFSLDGKQHLTSTVPAIRVREWGFNDDPSIRPNPLHLMGQSVVPLTKGIHTPLTELWLVHMVWILMGMEIAASRTELPDRHGRKRARDLKHAEVRVITLRRPARSSARPSATPRHIDWSCTWLVRGHWRKAPHGGTFADGRDRTWIRAYLKGPDGAPLRASDILFKLSR